ncbi:dynein axonemal assembly factor 1 homolog [Uranotaenia lowii]|uniref:dynein axonemal assembly factor 1 homolog n=1 Tax=Uranotaenia lowii TaxID=190385 RepID=UPI002478A495|nr:dynein axonemal assembly factor 1 homolog [Uranotaenia lowii]
MVRGSEQEDFGPKKMTKKSLVDSCKKNKLYLTPHLNDVLYLHYSGYDAIESLEEYVGLKCLWLECNAISVISGLEHQTELKCLYLQNNLLQKIENLEHCKQLDTLNLSHNHINRIENCGSDILPVLNTLNLSHNYLKCVENLEQLRNCHNLSVLDISHNRIDDIAIVKILGDMKALRVLTMTGNSVVNVIPAYRKTLILECKNLTYLDTRPVFDRDRACAEAWKRGGYEEERRELQRWKKEEQRKIRRSVNATLRMRHRGDGEPELLKTSSDEEPESIKYTEPLMEMEQKSNEQAWDEVERMFCNAQRAKPATPLKAIEPPNEATSNENLSFDPYSCFRPQKKPLIEEVFSDDDFNREEKETVVQVPKQFEQDTEHLIESEEGCHPLQVLKPLKELIAEDPCNSPIHEEPSVGNKSLVEELNSEIEHSLELLQKTEKVESAEQEDDTLNVVFNEENKQISIILESKEGEIIGKVDSRPSSSTGRNQEEDQNEDSLESNVTKVSQSSSVPESSEPDSSDSEAMYDKIIPKKNPRLATNYTSSSSTPSESENEEPDRAPVKLEREKSIAQCIDEYKKFFQSVNVIEPNLDEKAEKSQEPIQNPKTMRTDPREFAGMLRTMQKNSNQAKIEQARQERQSSKENIIDRFIRNQDDLEVNLEEQELSIGGEKHDFREYQLATFRKDQDKLQNLIDKVNAQKDLYNAHIDEIHVQLANIMEDYGQIGEKLRKVDNLLQNINDETKPAVSEKRTSIEEEIPEEIEVECSELETTQESGEEFDVLRLGSQGTVEQIVEKLISAQPSGMFKAPPESSDSLDENVEENQEDVRIPKTTAEATAIFMNPHQIVDEVLESAQTIVERIKSEKSIKFSDSAQTTSSGSSDEDEPPKELRPDHSLLELLTSPKPVLVPPQDLELEEELQQDPIYRKFIEIQHEIDQLADDEIYNIVTEATEELSDNPMIGQQLNCQVDQYWKRYEDPEDMRRNINISAHPIITKFRQFIRRHSDRGDDRVVADLDKVRDVVERRLSSQVYDSYMVMNRNDSSLNTSDEKDEDLEFIDAEGDEAAEGLIIEKGRAWEEVCENEEDEFEDLETPDFNKTFDMPEVEDVESNEIIGDREDNLQDRVTSDMGEQKQQGEALFVKHTFNSDSTDI